MYLCENSVEVKMPTARKMQKNHNLFGAAVLVGRAVNMHSRNNSTEICWFVKTRFEMNSTASFWIASPSKAGSH